MKPDLIKHLAGEPLGRFPVWAMRQAGRYLPSYRAIRAKHSFWEMVSLPEVAAEVSLTPVAELPVDAVIFFSDILTLPYGLGVPIEMREGVGPVCTSPLRSAAAFAPFADFEPTRHTPYVPQALRQIKGRIPQSMALLGFAGAPWTVSCYLAGGKAGKKFEGLQTWAHQDPQELREALTLLAGATVRYLRAQIEAGVDAVQVFDTWLCEMPKAFFDKVYQPILVQMFEELRKEKVPVIYFSRHAHHLLDRIVELPIDVLSADELLPLGDIDKRAKGRLSLQGNLDPLLLFCDEGTVRRETRALVQEARGLSRPAILNLGHGILPGTPVANVRAFFEEARQLWV
ncbi:uroporphyrinogen decarboxylase [bacterium]|nr:uroporphyrinogen decarboxylase [bacterium]